MKTSLKNSAVSDHISNQLSLKLPSSSSTKRPLSVNKKHHVYIASPFFTPDHLTRVALVEQMLEKLGYTYFSPRKELVCPPTATEKQRRDTFQGNHDGILNAEMVIAITDGKDVGTIWEMGVAYQANVPVVGVALTLGQAPFNLMLSESCTTTARTPEELEEFLVSGKSIYYQGEIE